MALFDKLKEPVFLKSSSSAEKQLEQLQTVDRERLPDELKEQLDRDIKLVSLGIQGEKNVDFELRNSHIPMYVLHDIYLEYGELSAQIDYMLVTRGCFYVIECKNLYGNIEVNSKGDFIRTINFGKRYLKEGIYSPITQNRRHLELIKQVRGEEFGALKKLAFEKFFYDNYRSVIVLANPKTVVNDKYANKEIKAQIIRADALIDYIRRVNSEAKKDRAELSDKDMEERAEFFLSKHSERNVDYAEKYHSSYLSPVTTERVEAIIPERPMKATDRLSVSLQNPEQPGRSTVCPKCGAEMVLRTAQKGGKVGNQFWGCSKFPKCKGIINVK